MLHVGNYKSSTVVLCYMSIYCLHHMSLVVSLRKQVFGVFDQVDINRAVQPQKMARGLKFRI